MSPASPALTGRFFTTSTTWETPCTGHWEIKLAHWLTQTFEQCSLYNIIIHHAALENYTCERAGVDTQYYYKIVLTLQTSLTHPKRSWSFSKQELLTKETKNCWLSSEDPSQKQSTEHCFLPILGFCDPKQGLLIHSHGINREGSVGQDWLWRKHLVIWILPGRNLWKVYTLESFGTHFLPT